MLNPDFRDILSIFCEERVDFLLVGAYALAVHSQPRATGDIDLWIRCSEKNAHAVWRSLKKFGTPLFDLTLEDLQTSGIVFQIGVVPSRIDILTMIDGVLFDEAWEQRQEVEIEGMSIFVISRQHFIQNKKAAGRPKDLADVNWLENEDD